VQWQEIAMSEYGEIFDYQLSMMGFEYLSLAIFAVYGVVIMWILSRPISSIHTETHTQKLSADRE
jgi:hypothetical protein